MVFRAFFLAVIGILVGGGPALADGYLQGRRESGSCCFWNGFYIGVHGGYASGTLLPPTRNTGLASDISLSGGFGGLQTGYNVQVSPNWFFGVEQDIWFGRISGGAGQPFPDPTIGIETTVGGTVRGRFGYVMGRHALFYSTAGVAWALNRGSLDFHTPAQQAAAGADHLAYSEQHLHLGFALGNGIEWAIDRQFSIKAEYQFLYLTKEQYFAGTTEGAVAGFHDHTFRVGLNWRMH
jgi:opacity protein-like surface antigen